ncbi:uncharacterized protein PV07_08467 [Cladophialophora immunda]|uniref:Peptidase M20 dimerisation domain-containing protein n=1 Tax=Cladophialophora immunda TaxID=569365 RepID=A0A0D1ZBZ8_9EURO|nr:uncharacterized protein PV07_08467 [Cladophialophora immunda]KIW25276.1 hypothetical protein PV07_08467 [Cladophialophora immunda]
MIDDGLYDACPPPDLMLAQHVGMPKAGLVAVRTGPVLPASDYVEIKIHSDGVGVNPSECPEPVSIASYLVTRFQRIVGTDIDHKDFATLVYRDLHAGGPGTLFTNQVFHAVKAITNAECGVFAGKVTATVEMSSRAPVTVNDTQMAQQLQVYFTLHFGDRFWVPPMDTPAEDFSLLSAARKGGSILEHLPTKHSPEFAPAPELTISTGTDAMALATMLFC